MKKYLKLTIIATMLGLGLAACAPPAAPTQSPPSLPTTPSPKPTEQTPTDTPQSPTATVTITGTVTPTITVAPPPIDIKPTPDPFVVACDSIFTHKRTPDSIETARTTYPGHVYWSFSLNFKYMIAGSPIGCLQIYGRNVALENVSDAKSMDKFDLIGMYEITCTIIGGSAQTRTKHDLKSRASEAGPAEVMKVTLKGEDHIVCAFGQGKNKSIIQAIVASKAKVDSGRMPNLLKAIEDFEKAMSKGNTVVELDDITLAAAGKLAKSESGWPLLAYKSENKKIPTLGFSVAQPEKNGPGQLAATYYYSSDKELKSVTQPAEPTKCAPLIEVDQATFWWLEFGDPNRNNHDPSTQRREWQPVWRQDGSNPLEFNSYHRCPGPWKTDSPLPFDLGPATLYIGSDSEEKQFYQGDLYEIFVDPDNSIKALPTG